MATATMLLGACGSSRPASAPTSTTRAESTTSTTAVGRAVTTSMSFRDGLMRLDPSEGAPAAVTAERALAAAGGTTPGDRPQVLLGRLTVLDYARGTQRLVDRRLVWLVVYPHHFLMSRGPCRTNCGAQSTIWLVPVDARTGAVLGAWSSTT